MGRDLRRERAGGTASATDSLEVPARRISLRKLLLATRAIWEALELGRASLSARQTSQMLEGYFQRVQREAILPPGRPRHCQRAIRQPVSRWPRLRERCNTSGHVSIAIVR